MSIIVEWLSELCNMYMMKYSAAKGGQGGGSCICRIGKEFIEYGSLRHIAKERKNRVYVMLPLMSNMARGISTGVFLYMHR